MYKNIFTLMIIFVLYSCSTVNKHIKRAERYTSALKIDKAINEYKKALEINKDNYKANAALGVMLCDYMNLYEDALPYLENAYYHSPKDTSADIVYALAKSYQYHGQFEKAIEMLNNLNDVIATEENDKEFQMDLKKRKQDCNYAIQHQNKSNKNIKVINLGKTVNTSAPEYVPTYLDNELYFTSKRKDSNKEKFSEWDGKYFEAMYTAKMKNGSPEKIDYLYIPKNNKKMKPNDNRSIISVSGNKKYLFIFENTKITQVSIDSINTQKNRHLSNTINFSYYQSHAFLTKDEKTLYFTSDSESGIGGLDIYVSRKNSDGTWSAPENVGSPINTEYDEDAPFLSEDEKTLYFASTGHPGFGNYDIYKSEWVGTHWSEPVNLGPPINSYGHDIYYIEEDAQKNVFFSSYRKGGYGDMDIYKILYMDKFKDMPLSNIKIGEIAVQKNNDTTYHLWAQIPSLFDIYYPQWKYKNQQSETNETAIVIPISKQEKIIYEAILLCDTCLNPIKIQLEKTIENTLPAIVSNTTSLPKTDINTLPEGEIPASVLASIGFDTSAVYFDFDKTNIKEEEISKLNKNIDLLNQYHLSIKIEAYSDMYGHTLKHRQISKDRAKQVYMHVIKNGLNKKQIIEYKGKGSVAYCNERDLKKCPDKIHARHRYAKIRVFKVK